LSLTLVQQRLRVNQVVSETPLSFLKGLQEAIMTEGRVLRFCSSRLASLLNTLQINETDQFGPLRCVQAVAAL
jgi:DNA excision repair protein ERCC-2